MCALALNVLQWINSWFHFRPLLRYRCMYLSRFKCLNRRLVSISLKSVLIKWKQYIVVSIKRLLNVISAFAPNATDIVSYCRRMRFYYYCCCCCIFPLFSKHFKPCRTWLMSWKWILCSICCVEVSTQNHNPVGWIDCKSWL